MFHGVVVTAKVLLESISYWKMASHNPENLASLAPDKEAYLRELVKGDYEGLSYIVFKTSLTKELHDVNVDIQLLRTSKVGTFFVGGSYFVHSNIFGMLPSHLSLMSELEPQVQELLKSPFNEWMQKDKEKFDKGLSILGLDEFPIQDYFAGEGGGPMSLNGPPSVIPGMKSRKIQ